MRSLSVPFRGVDSRFCQQCGRFQELSAFDGEHRSCRERLLRHAGRRRRQSFLNSISNRALGRSSDEDSHGTPGTSKSDGGSACGGSPEQQAGPSSPARVSQPGERACHLGAAAPHQSGSAGATEAMLGFSMQSSGSLPSDTPPIPILRWGHRNRRLNSQPELGASEEQYPQCWGRTFPPTSGHRNALLRPSVQPVARPIWSPTSAFQPYALSTAPEPGTSGMVPPAANPAEWARPSREYAQAEHGTGEQAREPRPLSDAHERYTGLDAPDTLQRTSEAHQHGPATRQSPPGAPEPPKATRRQLLNLLRLLRILGQRQQIEARRDPPAYHGGSFHGAGC